MSHLCLVGYFSVVVTELLCSVDVGHLSSTDYNRATLTSVPPQADITKYANVASDISSAWSDAADFHLNSVCCQNHLFVMWLFSATSCLWLRHVAHNISDSIL